MSEIQAIIDEIVIIQKAMTPPTNEKGIQLASDEWPESGVGTFPSFVNHWVGRANQYFSGLRESHHEIKMYLVFAKSGAKYSERSARKWDEVVHTAFQGEVSLNGTVTQAWISGSTLGPIEEVQGEYIGISFTLEIEEKSAVAMAG